MKEQYEKDGTIPSLSEHYQDLFPMGVAVNRDDVQDPAKQKLILSQFVSLTCENEMKADFVLDREATLESGADRL